MDWSSLSVSAGTSYVGKPPPSGDGIETAPPFHSVWFILNGSADVRRGRKTWHAGPGSGLAMPVNWRRFQSFSADARLVSLGLRVAWPDGQPLLEQDAPVLLNNPELQTLATRAVALTSDQGSGWMRARSALYAYAAAWLDELLSAGARLRAAGCGDARLDRARRILCAHPELGPLPYTQLTAASGLSRTQLDRQFRTVIGATPLKIRDRAVLARARELLADPALKLSAVAHQLGATDASHLVKWFRRQTGHTPGEERRLGPQA
ncbi:MAG: AraC family transcriptional regulator [Planctomycetota bacterium]